VVQSEIIWSLDVPRVGEILGRGSAYFLIVVNFIPDPIGKVVEYGVSSEVID
jgi:hypothetical protein